jgi:signal transduction histidine kinase
LLDAALTPARMRAIVLAALVAGAGVIALVVTSDHQESKEVWAIFGPAVGWNFVGTGLYAWRRRPESRIGPLMVLLGFAWFLSTLSASNAPLVWTAGTVTGGLWGGVFLHLAVTFPTGRLETRVDRGLVTAGYVLFPLGLVPALLFAGPEEINCDCPTNLFLIEHNADLASFFYGFAALLYVALFVLVLARSIVHWRGTSPLERLQLTPVYVCALLTFLLVVVARVGDSEEAWWAAFVSSALLPFAFLAGLLRSRVSQLDAELRARLEELRASRARVVQASDAERRRLERDLHDGAQSRLVALALVLRSARARANDPELAALLDTAQDELTTSLAELRELARGIHPAILTERGLEPALQTLVARVPLPVELQTAGDDRLPGPVECAAYFVVSEALANVAKYARATHATVAIRRMNGRLTVEVSDDGIGGADAARGSGLRGLADRVAALDGTLSLDSPAGRGTCLRAEIPCGP